MLLNLALLTFSNTECKVLRDTLTILAQSIRLSTNKTSFFGVVISKIKPPFIATSYLFVLRFSIRPSGIGS